MKNIVNKECIIILPKSDPTATPTPTTTPTLTPSPTTTSTATPPVTQTQTSTKTPTQTSTKTATPSQTPTITPTNTSTNTPTPSVTPTNLCYYQNSLCCQDFYLSAVSGSWQNTNVYFNQNDRMYITVDGCASYDISSAPFSNVGPEGFESNNPALQYMRVDGRLRIESPVGAAVLTARESNRFWSSIASSSDGVKLVAVARDGQIYTSIDSGTTWTPRESNRFWTSVASSSDGTKLVAVTYNGGQIYTSVDSGITWVPRGSNLDWVRVVSSSDGTKLVAASFDNTSAGGKIYTSTDSGVTWTERAALRFQDMASSSDGNKLVGVVSGHGFIYTSTDGGITWVPRETNRNWWRVASSSDGSKLVASVFGGRLYTSTDSGLNWTPRESDRFWEDIESSSDGTRLFAAVNFGSGGIYISTDSGITWTPTQTDRNWRKLAISSDGTKLVAIPESVGQIYTGVQGSISTNISYSNIFKVGSFYDSITASAGTLELRIYDNVYTNNGGGFCACIKKDPNGQCLAQNYSCGPPEVSQSSTPTPTQTTTKTPPPTPSNTSTQTPTQTPTKTSAETQTPTSTPSQTKTPTPSPTSFPCPQVIICSGIFDASMINNGVILELQVEENPLCCCDIQYSLNNSNIWSQLSSQYVDCDPNLYYSIHPTCFGDIIP